MGRDSPDALVSHKIAGVIILVCTDGFLLHTLEGSGNQHDLITLSRDVGWTDLTGLDRADAVLHDAVHHET